MYERKLLLDETKRGPRIKIVLLKTVSSLTKNESIITLKSQSDPATNLVHVSSDTNQSKALAIPQTSNSGIGTSSYSGVTSALVGLQPMTNHALTAYDDTPTGTDTGYRE